MKAASDWLRGLGVDDLSKCKWSISGHSRVGLLAFHAGWHVAQRNRRLGSLVHVITFGAPHASRHEDNGMMSNYVFRVVNCGDPVPQLLSSSVEAELQLRAEEKTLRSTPIGSAKRFVYFLALNLALRVQ